VSTLGETLSQLQDQDQVFALLAEAGDVMSIASLDNVARATGQDLCDLVLEAVQLFTDKADDEAWVRLIGQVQNADSPGAACLSEMITWFLER